VSALTASGFTQGHSPVGLATTKVYACSSIGTATEEANAEEAMSPQFWMRLQAGYDRNH
jgi:hypothetical protein